MKFVSYSKDGGEIRAGLSIDGKIVDLADGAKQIGATLPSNVVEILALGETGMTIAGDVADAAATGNIATTPESDVTLEAAIQTPPTIFLLAGNYQSHLIEGGGSAVEKDKVNPRPFIKPTTAIIGTGDPIVIPPDSDTLDYEIEIAAVIGKEGRAISVADANDYVAGYTVFNDVSARSLKIAEGRTERNGDGFFDWLLGKWCDSFAAIGPYLVTKDEAGDPNESGDGAHRQWRAAAAFGRWRNDLHHSRIDCVSFALRHPPPWRFALHGHARRRRRDDGDVPESRRHRSRKNRQARHTGEQGSSSWGKRQSSKEIVAITGRRSDPLLPIALCSLPSY